MKLVILSRNRRCYSTRRLREAASQRGCRVKVLDTLKFALEHHAGKPRIYYRGKRLSTYDAALPRIGASITDFGASLLRQFELMKVPTSVTADALLNSRNKLLAQQRLTQHGVPTPPTAAVHRSRDLESSIDRLGGPPVVLKLLRGAQGRGVVLADSMATARSIFELLHSTNQQLLVQRFIGESRGRDVRVIVVGGRVVAAMRRYATGDEFRSNVHRGGRTEQLTLEEPLRQTAIAAAAAVGLQVAGVDLLESDQGPLVLEVNSSPGLEGIENCTGTDVAGAIIEHLCELAAQSKHLQLLRPAA